MNDGLMDAFSLAGRVAFVTGAASGIGRETARILARAGARVVLADVSKTGAEAAAAEMAAERLEGVPLELDVSDRNRIEACAAETMRRFGRLDVWVNAAGVLDRADIVDVSPHLFDRVMRINLSGTFWGCAAAGRIMSAQGSGSIVNLSSNGADKPVAGLSVYAMTKASVNMLTRVAAAEFGPSGVRVNAIAPGWVDTAMTTYRFTDPQGGIDPVRKAEVLEMMAGASVLGMTGEPWDIAMTVLYLASDASRFMTGQILRPNGGSVMP